MPIGFIGVGNMGQPMARCLAQAGYSIVIHDVRKVAVREVFGDRATWSESPQDLAAQCKIICTSLPGPTEAERVLLGERGVLQGIQPGAVLVDFTTNAPLLVRRVGESVRQRQADMIDAPVSGGVERAATGSLTIMVGGRAETVERVRSLLDCLAANVLHVGELGAASICKVLHNCAVFCANLAMVECFTAGIKAGVEAHTLVDVFQRSGIGKNLDLNVAMPATLFRGRFTPRFALKTAHKDMRLAIELAADCGTPMPLAEICLAEMAEAIKRGWGDLDNTAFLRLQEERAGVEVRCEPPAPSNGN